MSKKIPKGLIYGFIIGIVISLFYFIPVIQVVPIAIGVTIEWLWEILFSSILNYETYAKISIYKATLVQLILMVIIFSLIGSSYSSKRIWLKVIGIIATVLFILAIAVRFIIPMYLM